MCRLYLSIAQAKNEEAQTWKGAEPSVLQLVLCVSFHIDLKPKWTASRSFVTITLALAGHRRVEAPLQPNTTSRGETQLLLQETGIEVQGRWLLMLSLESKREFLQVSMATTEFCPSTVIRLPGDSIALITTVTVRRPSRPAHACRPAG